MTARSRNTLVLTGAVLLTVFLFGRIDYRVSPYTQWDLVAYLHMAEAAPALALDVGLPYASRLLGPLLVGLGPLPAPVMFRLLTIVVALILSLVFFRFLLRRGVDEYSALTAVLLFIFNKQFFGYNLWNYFQLNDLLGLLFLVILFEAMFESRWIVFGVVMFLGAVTRETTMVMIPVGVVYLWEKGRLKAEGGRLLVAAAPGLILFLGLRFTLPVRGLGILEAFSTYSVKAGAWRTWFYLFVYSVAPVTFLPAVFFRRTADFFRTRRFALLFVGLVSLSAFFGSNNERLMAPVFIVFYWLIGDILTHELQAGTRAGRMFLVGCGFVAMFHQMFTRFNYLEKKLVVGMSLGSLLLVTIVSILFIIRKKSRTPSQVAGQ